MRQALLIYILIYVSMALYFIDVIRQNLRLFCLALHNKIKRENIFCFSFVPKTYTNGLKNTVLYIQGFSA